MKKVSITSMILLLVCSLFVSVVSADADNISQPKNSKPYRVPFELLNQQSMSNEKGAVTITITDPQKLKEIALEEGLNEVPKSVEYEYFPNENSNKDIYSLLANEYWLTTEDRGRGHYSSSDMYKEFYVYGPDTFKISEDTEVYSKKDGSLNVELYILSGAVGFEIGRRDTSRWESVTTIAKNEKIRFQLYTTHHKVDYWEWFGPKYNKKNSKCTAAGSAYNPDGVLIKKTTF